ncbi:hypothetical protein ABK040_003796 [Willaertia magna]
MKDSTTAYLLWLGCCFGLCGLHRFYLNQPLLGIVWLLTGGLCGIGQLIDLCLIPGIVDSCNLAERGANTNTTIVQNINVQQPIQQPYVQQPYVQQPYVQQPYVQGPPQQ